MIPKQTINFREMLVKMPKTDQMVIKVQSEFQAKTMSETKGSKEQRVPQDKKDHLDLLVNTQAFC
jgi:hypothetical protein